MVVKHIAHKSWQGWSLKSSYLVLLCIIYGRKSRQMDQNFDIIFSTTRLKLMTIKFKDSSYVDRMKIEWNFDGSN